MVTHPRVPRIIELQCFSYWFMLTGTSPWPRDLGTHSTGVNILIATLLSWIKSVSEGFYSPFQILSMAKAMPIKSQRYY